MLPDRTTANGTTAPQPGTRWLQALLIATFLPFCWLAMQVVHEAGHVAAAWGTGGDVERVLLHPAAISRTDVSPNPQPLVVAWGGPIAGVLLPLAVWGVWMPLRKSSAALPQFFAGFCLISNGAYLSVGAFTRVGDAGDLLCHGSPAWMLWLFGAVCAPLGLWLWNGLGPAFGLGTAQGRVDPRAAYVSAAALTALLIAELLLSTTG